VVRKLCSATAFQLIVTCTLERGVALLLALIAYLIEHNISLGPLMIAQNLAENNGVLLLSLILQ